MLKNLLQKDNNPGEIRKSATFLLLALFILLSINKNFAEGSIDFRDAEGFRLFYFAERYQQIKVYAAEGEFINLGSSHVGITGGTMSIYRPDGTLHTLFNNSGATAGLGIINNDVEELNGPTGAGLTMGNGYVPGIVEVQNGEEGVWTVLLEYPTYINSGFKNLENNEPWNRIIDQPTNRRVVLAWDVTVSQNAAGNGGGDLLTGRVYSNEYQSIVSLNGNTTSPTFYILTEDGFQFRVDYDEVDPWGFQIFSNSWGVVSQDDNIQPTYLSFDQSDVIRSDDIDNWSLTQKYLYDPQAQDTEDIVNNKVFFNIPDSSLPTTALVTDIKGPDRGGGMNTHTTWLYNIAPEVNIKIEEITLVNVDENGDPLPEGVFGTKTGAYLDFNTNIGGSATFKIDLNNDGIYGNANDRIIYKRSGIGANQIFWNGKDGNGEFLEQAFNRTITFTLEITGGELHILMIDVENDNGGVKITRINGVGAPDSNVLYNHSSVGSLSSGGNDPLNPLPTELPFIYGSNFGDEKILDYWTYVGFALDSESFVLDVIDDINNLSADSDLDGDRDDEDLDDDNDGIPDVLEFCLNVNDFSCLPNSLNPMYDGDFDGIPNYRDASDPSFVNECVDLDNDGICDQIPLVYDTDGDNIPNNLDLDSDNDGITDLEEANHGMPDLNGDGVIDSNPGDFGMNGLFNAIASDPDMSNATVNYTLLDSDNDNIIDALDSDSDNDGIHDLAENGYGYLDLNNNGKFELGESNLFFDEDGVASFISNILTGQAIAGPIDTDLDGIANYIDLDSDNDGITDVTEGGNEDADNDGVIGFAAVEVDIFGNPTLDANLVFLSSSSFPGDFDSDSYPNFLDHDADNDGIYDSAEASYQDSDEDGFAGSGTLNINSKGMISSDGSGVFIYDNNSLDPDLDTYPNFLDLDSDNDGINDTSEGGNEDPNDDGVIGSVTINVNAMGVPISDNTGASFISTSNPSSSDSDNIPDYLDLDSDNDGINDVAEGGNEDVDDDGVLDAVSINDKGLAIDNLGQVIPSSNSDDTDNDGVPNYKDLDADNDGINDVVEGGNEDSNDDGEIGNSIPNVNANGQIIDSSSIVLSSSNPDDNDTDTYPNYLDLDSDNDGINDVEECGGFDSDNDGVVGIGSPNILPNGQTLNTFGAVASKSDPLDTDGDGSADYLDLDSDDDGIFDVIEADFSDTNNDGIPGDGAITVNAFGQIVLVDGTIISVTSNPVDTDDDGTPDYQDTDSDGDDILDSIECPGGSPCPDTDSDGVDDWRDVDCATPVDQPTLSFDDQSCTSQLIEFSINEAGFYDTNFPGSTITYYWFNAFGQSIANSSANIIMNVTDPSLIFPVSVMVEIDGCESDPSESLFVDYSDLAIAEASASVLEICAGEDIQLNANSIFGADYVWTNVNTGVEVSVIQNPLVQSLNQTTTFRLTMDVPGCPDLVSDEITVVANQVPEITDLIGTGLYCEGESILLTADNNFLLTGNLTYTWTGPNLLYTNTVPANEPFDYTIPNATTTEAGMYSLVVVSEENCSSPTEMVNIQVQEALDIPIISSDDQVICNGDNITLTSTTSNAPNATYEWYFNGNIVSITSTPTFTINNTALGNTGTYSVQVNAGSCVPVNSGLVEVEVLDVSTAPEINIGSQSTYCEGEGVALAVNNPMNHTTYTWFDPNGNQIFVGTSLSINSINALQAGNYSVMANINDCAMQTSFTNIMVVESLDTPVLDASSETICEGSNTTLSVINNTSIPGAVYNWYDSNGALVGQTNQPSFELDNVVSSDAGEYYLVIEVGACVSEQSVPLNIDVEDAPTELANAGQDESSCGFEELNITASPAMQGTGMWTSTTANIVDPTNSTSLVTNLNQGANNFVWSLSTPTCGVYSTDTVTIMFTTPPDESANIIQPAITICEDTPLELNANAVNVSTGTWTQMSGPTAVTFDDPESNNATLTNLTPGTYTFDWSLSFANCGIFSTDQIVVQVDESPTEVADAGVDQVVCGEQLEIVLNALMPSVGTGVWTSTSALIAEPSNPNSVVTNLQSGINIFNWVLSNGVCEDYSMDPVQIEFLPQPDDEAQVLQSVVSICESELSTFSLEAVAPTMSSGTWTQIAGPSGLIIDEPSNSSSTLQGLTSGTYTFEWALSFSNCGVYDTEQMELTIDQQPTQMAEAGDDITICDEQAGILSAVLPSIGIGVWTSADATILDPSDPFSAISNLQVGQNTFTWTLSNGACNDYSADVMVINYMEEPSEQAQVLEDDIIICEDDLSNLNLNAVAPSVAVGTWIQLTGPTSVDIPNPNNENLNLDNLIVGTYTFEWALSFGVCGKYSESIVTVTVQDLPDDVFAQAGVDREICGDNTINLSATMPSVGSGLWTSSTSTVNDSNNPLTEVILEEGINIFTWTLSNGVCEDYSSDEVQINFTSLPNESANILTDDIVVCEENLSLGLSLTAQNVTESSGEWSLISGPSMVTIVDPSLAQLELDDLVSGTYLFSWTLTKGNCIDFSSDQISVEIVSIPNEEAMVRNKEEVVCSTENIVIEAIVPNIATGEWSSPSGATIISQSESMTEVGNLQLGENLFVWSLSNGPCENFSQDLMTIFVEEDITAREDQFSTEYNTELQNLNLVNNDVLNGNIDWNTNLVSGPSSGTLYLNSDGSFDYFPEDGFSGEVTFQYEICNESCDECDPAVVTIMVNREEILDCEVPNIMTPNNDLKNDALEILCASQFPENQICIFNRWGDQVYETSNYQNDWIGTYNGDQLPAGTYFYIFKRFENDPEAMTGYVTILH